MLTKPVYVLLAASIGAAVASPFSRAIQKRSCGETATRVCFGIDGGDAQNINVDDIAYAASYLRNIAKENVGTPGAFWTSKFSPKTIEF